MKIHKTQVTLVRGKTFIKVPVVHKMLDCQMQYGFLTFWYEVNLDVEPEYTMMRIEIIYTGDFSFEPDGTYFRTIQYEGLVYHIFI